MKDSSPLAEAIHESSDIVLDIAKLANGRTVLAFYVALLRVAKTMEQRYQSLRPVRDAVLNLECGDARGGESSN